ncbi:MAG: gamma-glutamyl-gamma-aminobutyrate hydrolase family protein [Desulfobacteraceae bacterium]
MIIALSAETEKDKIRLSKPYIDYVVKAGYEPVVVSPANDPIIISEICDALLLTGGRDVDQIYYDEDNISSFKTDPNRDQFERTLLWTFIAKGKPVMGICRGLQLMALEFMDRYIDHEEDTYLEFREHIPHHSVAESLNLMREHPHHFVKSFTNTLYKGKHTKNIDKLPVNSMHHQGLCIEADPEYNDLNEIHDGIEFKALAWTDRGITDKDEDEQGFVIYEAFELIGFGTSRIVAVQWHPEELEDIALLKGCFELKRGKTKKA